MGIGNNREARYTAQKGETRQAFQAFATYRDLGQERSTARVARELSKSKVLMDRWSGRWAWVERAAAYDADMDEIGLQKKRVEVDDMRRRHTTLSQGMQGIVMKKLQEWQENIPSMTPAAAAQVLKLTAELERLSRGEATEITESTATARVELRAGESQDAVRRMLVNDPESAQLMDDLASRLSAANAKEAVGG